MSKARMVLVKLSASKCWRMCSPPHLPHPSNLFHSSLFFLCRSDESALKSSVRSDGESWRKITISSSHPGEGKPFVSILLSFSSLLHFLLSPSHIFIFSLIFFLIDSDISCYDYEPMRGSVFTERKKWLYLTGIYLFIS